jgi:hypothetical protein
VRKGIFVAILFLFFAGCEEKQNKILRGIQNFTGVNGVLEVYSGGKIVKRFMKIDKISTAVATETEHNRPYRYGYGYIDRNLNGVLDGDEDSKKVYFEFSDYSTQYIFYEDTE